MTYVEMLKFMVENVEIKRPTKHCPKMLNCDTNVLVFAK